MFGELKQGIAYVRQQRSIMALMVLGAATAFFGIPMLTLLPVFATGRVRFRRRRLQRAVVVLGRGRGVGGDGGGVARPLPHMGRTTLLVEAWLGIIIALVAWSRWLP